MLFSPLLRRSVPHVVLRRCLSTLATNPNIFVLTNPHNPRSKILTLLATQPPTPELALGETNDVPPSPSSFQENQKFLRIMHSVIAENAHSDPQVKAQAVAMVASTDATIAQINRSAPLGSAPASGQASEGGFIHVSDNRHPPDFGRIADPEDIFGSLEVDGDGTFTDGNGRYQESGTYRLCTRDGVLGLSDYLRSKLVERLQVEEAAIKNKS